jgi:DNA-binding MarR family transcriptional regulator
MGISQADLTRLRVVLGRLGRVLRQQNLGDLGFALISLLFTIARIQPATAGQLAADEGISPPAVTRSLNRLVELGLVSREADTTDRRAAVIRLTEQGQHELDVILRMREAWLVEHLSTLSDEDIRIIFAALPAFGRLIDPVSENHEKQH